MRKALFGLCVTAALTSVCMTAQATPDGGAGIAATVNDEVVTKSDVDSRMQLYLSGMQSKPPPDARKQMEGKVLDKLIDEKLQMHEAKTLGITVSESEITTAFAQIAKQNNLPPEEFKKRLIAEGIRINTLNDQLKAEIAWSGVIKRRLRPQISVSEKDIDNMMSTIARNGKKPQYLVAEIFLAVSDPAQDSSVRGELEKIAMQLKKGAHFQDIAREYSQAPGAAHGGDLGWVQEGQLDSKIDDALKSMQPGQLSPPIRTDNGYHLILLRELRQPSEGDAAPAKPGQDKREEVANRIGRQRLDQMQDRYLSDLRATAFIEKRL